jgi:hypothetical protein
MMERKEEQKEVHMRDPNSYTTEGAQAPCLHDTKTVTETQIWDARKQTNTLLGS